MLKKAVQRGRSQRGGDAYSLPYVEPPSAARTKPTDFFNILLVGVSQITIIGQREVSFSPLMRALKTPRFLDVEGFETEAVEASVDQVSQPRTRIFNQLSVGRTQRRLAVVAPARDPIPLAGRVTVVEPNLKNRSSGFHFLEPREETGFAILVRFDFYDHETIPDCFQLTHILP